MSTEDPRHGSDGLLGYESMRCAAGLDGCDDRACICLCHHRLGSYEEAPYGCPTCRTILNAKAAGGCPDLWHSDNRPAGPSVNAELTVEEPVDWGEWTPGKGMERIRKEMPGMVPDITEEDERAADELIAGPGRRCTSKIAHETGVVVRCLLGVDHATPQHRSGFGGQFMWLADDDRIISGPEEGGSTPLPEEPKTGWDEHGHAVRTGLPIDQYLGSGDLQDGENCGYAPVAVLAEIGVDKTFADAQIQFRDGRIVLTDGTVLERGGTLNCVWAVTRLPRYTEADVDALAAVIHDARDRGIWHGNYTLARWILDHWQPGGTT